MQASFGAATITHQSAIVVRPEPITSSVTGVVNAGSFKGFVAIYAKGYEGKRLSAKVGRDWVVINSLASNFVRVVEFTGAGVELGVKVYIDRVLIDTISLITK
jgi:hypothetical protein